MAAARGTWAVATAHVSRRGRKPVQQRPPEHLSLKTCGPHPPPSKPYRPHGPGGREKTNSGQAPNEQPERWIWVLFPTPTPESTHIHRSFACFVSAVVPGAGPLCDDDFTLTYPYPPPHWGDEFRPGKPLDTVVLRYCQGTQRPNEHGRPLHDIGNYS